MKKILIFGATGSVGVYTSLTLKEKGYDVVAIGHRRNDNDFFKKYDIPYYPVDIKDVATFEKLPKKFDQVIHFAGAMPARMRGYDPYAYVQSIVIGTLNILEYMRINGCSKIIFSQSIADILYKFGSLSPISDDVERRFPLNTDHSVYSISKNAAVNLIEHYSAAYDFDRFILRLPTIYVYQPNPFYYVDGKEKWMGYRYIINQAIKGETLEIWGDPSSAKEMVYVKDFVQLVEKCVEANHKGGIYNVGCGRPIAIAEQIKIIADVFQREKKSDIVFCPQKPSSPQFVLDISKARRELGYEPQYDFRSMMEDFKRDMEIEPFAQLWGRASDYVIDK